MSKKSLVLVGILVIAIIAAFGVMLKTQKMTAPVAQNQVIPVPQSQTTASENIDTSDWLTYESKEYGFKFKYPKEWSQLKVNVKKGTLSTSDQPSATVELQLPTSDKTWVGGEPFAGILYFYVFTPEQYNKFTFTDGSKPNILVNDKYIISQGAGPQDYPHDFDLKNLAEIKPGIISSVTQ